MGRCGNRSGCCTQTTGCKNDSSLLDTTFPYGRCSMKFSLIANDSNRYLSAHPIYGYNATDVQGWNDWIDQSGRSTSTKCKTLTAGQLILAASSKSAVQRREHLHVGFHSLLLPQKDMAVQHPSATSKLSLCIGWQMQAHPLRAHVQLLIFTLARLLAIKARID